MSGNEMATLYVLRCPLLRSKGISRHLKLDPATLNIPAIKRDMRGWSHGEQLLVRVALSLWNSDHKLNLYELVCTLSSNNVEILLTAIRIADGQYWPSAEEMGYAPATVAAE